MAVGPADFLDSTLQVLDTVFRFRDQLNWISGIDIDPRASELDLPKANHMAGPRGDADDDQPVLLQCRGWKDLGNRMANPVDLQELGLCLFDEYADMGWDN